MKPIELKIAGFMSYKDETVIDFSELTGLYLITGNTGAGKTAIFDAITYALYGKLSGAERSGHMGEIIRSDFCGPKDPTYVELTFEHKGKKYSVKRNPRYERLDKKSKDPNKTANENAGALLTMPDGIAIRGTDTVDSKIEEIIGFDYQQFKQVSMIAQGEFKEVLTQDSAARTVILRKLFGTEFYQRVEAAIKNARDAAAAEYEKAEDDAKSAIEKLECPEDSALKEDIEDIKSGKIADYVYAQPAVEALIKELTEAEKNSQKSLDGLNTEKKELSERLGKAKTLRKLEEDLEEKRKELSEKEAERAVIEESVEALEIRKDACNKAVSSLENDLKEIGGDDGNGGLIEETSNIGKKEEEARTLQSKDSTLETEADEARKNYEALFKSYISDQAFLIKENLSEGDICPVCGNAFHKESDEKPDAKTEGLTDKKTIDDASDARKKAEKELNDCRSKLLAASESAKELRRIASESYKNIMGSDMPDDISSAKTALSEKWNNINEEIENKNTEIEEIKKTIDNIRSLDREIAKLKASQESLEKQLVDADKSETDVEALERLYNEKEDEYKRIEIEKGKTAKSLTHNREAEEGLTKAISAMEKVKTKRDILEDLSDTATGSHGTNVHFESFAQQMVFEDILEKSNQWLEIVSGHRRKLVLKKERNARNKRGGLDINIYDKYTEKERSIFGNSGGESFEASLAFALGLSDTVQKKAGGIPVETLYIDEGFGSLSQDVLERTMEVLEELSSGDRPVGIISHVQELNEVGKKIEVSKGPDGVSKAQVVID